MFLNIKNLVLHITLNKEYSLLIYGAKKILFYTVGLHVSSYLETLYGVKTFAEVETSLIFDIVEIENLSKTIARDVDTWITNVPNIYKEICAG